MRTVMQATAPHGQVRRRGLVLLACTLVLATAAGSARASDKIEDNLPAQAFKVMRYLKKQGYQNVGVLKFRVQKGDQKPSFRVGPLNVAMATRLENVLLLMNDKSKPLGIIHDASQVAARKREKATYVDAAGCAKLFRYKYPLAWGNNLVTADAFVTGIVKINAVKRTTTVTIEAVDRKTKTLTPVTSFVVRTDRSILTDVCNNFALSKKKIRTMAIGDQDDKAGDPPPTKDKGGQPADRLVDLEILYDDAAQEPRQSRKDPNALEVDEPKENVKVVLRIKNKSDRRVAVRLEVNGLNTLYKEEAKSLDVLGGRKWVLDPNESWEVRGFYTSDTEYEPFKVLSDAESQQEDLSSNEFMGSIRMLVFEQGTGTGGGDGKITTQGLRKKLTLNKRKPRTAKEVASLVRKQKRLVKSQGLIKSNSTTEKANLQTVEFKDPKHAETRTIWYFNPMRQGE